jgi:hypothetical protein
MMIHCPTCGKKVFDTHQMAETEPFIATDPMHGLEVWGPYSAKKTILCQGRTWIHFHVNCEERLVELGVPLTEMDGAIEEDEDDDMFYGNNDDDDDDDHEFNHDDDERNDDLPF